LCPPFERHADGGRERLTVVDVHSMDRWRRIGRPLWGEGIVAHSCRWFELWVGHWSRRESSPPPIREANGGEGSGVGGRAFRTHQ